jgi:hypothetical protein
MSHAPVHVPHYYEGDLISHVYGQKYNPGQDQGSSSITLLKRALDLVVTVLALPVHTIVTALTDTEMTTQPISQSITINQSK